MPINYTGYTEIPLSDLETDGEQRNPTVGFLQNNPVFAWHNYGIPENNNFSRGIELAILDEETYVKVGSILPFSDLEYAAYYPALGILIIDILLLRVKLMISQQDLMSVEKSTILN